MSDNAASDRRALLKDALRAIGELKAKVHDLESAALEPVAVVGIGCRYPGGIHDPESYWRLLADRTDAVGEIPTGRWELFGNPKGQAVWHAGLVDGLDRFDPRFFGISAREAATMDPQQRMLTEVAWEALENAGQAPGKLSGSSTGVFIGISTHDYADLIHDTGAGSLDVYAASGNAHNAAAGRISFLLGLQGPSMAIDTACSSSLVSIHMACQSLRAKECRMALAGGVNALLTPAAFVCFFNWGMMAADGRCKTFDAAADGFVRSEGCGLVVLKRLGDAVADGDRILALIRGSAVNQDGRSSGLTVPNGLAQEAVIRQALANARVEPREVSYVEAHGTGTSLGDPIEAQALGAVFGPGRAPDRPLAVGSVKTNIGHAESAAGVAGLIKVVLSLQKRQIPAHLHFRQMNPRIDWNGLPVRIPAEPQEWAAVDGNRVAGVSAFGFSGTNAHLIVEEAPVPEPRPQEGDRPVHLLALSARSATALGELAAAYRGRLDDSTDPLGDVCFTANAGRSHFEHRLSLVAGSAEELRARLAEPPETARIAQREGCKPVFLFTGQGAQYAGMGRLLFETQPVFRAALERADEALRPLLEVPLLDVLYGQASGQLGWTAYAQPALFAVEYALCELWKTWGIAPAAALGHSVGEYAALCSAGFCTLADGLRLIAERGRRMQQLPGDGAMAAVFAAESAVRAAIGDCPGVSMAALNAPQNVVLSGFRAALEPALEQLRREGIHVEPLAVSHGFHSSQMDPMVEDFAARAAAIPWTAPQFSVVSSVTGEPVLVDQLRSSDYWRRQVRRPVQFRAAIETLARQGHSVFVEIGPGTTLLGLGRQTVGAEGRLWLPSLRSSQSDWRQMLESLGQLYGRGAEVDWSAFDAPYRRRRVALPTYPFERQRYWIEQKAAARLREREAVEETAPSATEDWIYGLAWEEVPFVEAGPPAGTGWLVLADRAGIGEALARRIRAAGLPCRILGPGEKMDACPDRQIVHLRSLDDPAGTLPFLQELAARRADGARVWLVTRGAQSVAGEAPDVLQAPVWGLGRTFAVEHAKMWGGLVDLDPAEADPELLWRHLVATGGEDQVALRGSRRLACRLERRPAAAGTLRLRPDGAYLITGGLGGLGLEIARFLVRNGARRLILMARTPLPPRAQWKDCDAPAITAIREMERQGVAIHTAAVDVADEAALRAFLEDYERECWPPVRGVVHAAGVLYRRSLDEMTPAEYDELLRPKLAARTLDRLLEGAPLDFFVLFSSASTILSSPKLGGFAAANCFLDALAHARRAAGKPALSIDWGAWTEAGMATHLAASDLQALGERGMGGIPTREGLEVFGRLLAGTQGQAAVLSIDWELWASRYPVYIAAPLLKRLFGNRTAEPAGHTAFNLATLLQAPAAQRESMLAGYLSDALAGILGFAAGTVDPTLPIHQLGVDSLMALGFKSRIETDLRISLPLGKILEGPPLTELAAQLLPELSRAGGPPSGDSGAVASMDPDRLSEAEIDAALAALLSGTE